MSPIDIVVPVAPRHERIARRSLAALAAFVDYRNLYVLANSGRRAAFNGMSIRGISILDSDRIFPDVTLRDLRRHFLERTGNAQRAGWYFQQFLKMEMCHFPGISERYLVWDADTILLRPLTLLSDTGRMFLTTVDGCHRPYLETIRRLLALNPNGTQSFVVQHQFVDTRAMTELIDQIGFGEVGSGWIWRLLDTIDDNLWSRSGFSEYETYGNFMYTHQRNLIELRKLPFTRDGTRLFGSKPNRYDLLQLAQRYCFASFETWQRPDPKIIRRAKLGAFQAFVASRLKPGFC